jgi:hypothetical protein
MKNITWMVNMKTNGSKWHESIRVGSPRQISLSLGRIAVVVTIPQLSLTSL